MKNFLKNRFPALIFALIAGCLYGHVSYLNDQLVFEKMIAKSRIKSIQRQYHTLDSLYKSGIPYSKNEFQASSGSNELDSLSSSKNQKSYPY